MVFLKSTVLKKKKQSLDNKIEAPIFMKGTDITEPTVFCVTAAVYVSLYTIL